MILETASTNRQHDVIERSIAHAPPRIRAAINRNRVAAGLPPLWAADRQSATRQPDGGGPGVYWDPRSPRRPKHQPALVPITAPPATVDRVLVVVAHGTAAARDVGKGTPEWIRPDAFGSAAELNGERGWALVDGHHGPGIALAGRRLVAHDTAVGLAIEWLPDPGSARDREILSRFRDGRLAASVMFKPLEDAVVALPHPTRVIRRARLVHVALLADGDRPAYAGAVAALFRGRPVGDAELRRQIDAVVAAARWRAERDG